MGAGRKTYTYDVDSRAEAAPSASAPQGFVESQRRLGKRLAAVIFGCTDKTFKECIEDGVFGLPKHHMLYVKDIQPGLPLFLFNYNQRQLYGVFRATSQGMLNAKPHGWTNGTGRPTLFPAQVRVEVAKKCTPLPENQFKPIIEKNYKDHHHFVFELDEPQVKRLCELFKCNRPSLSLLTVRTSLSNSHTREKLEQSSKVDYSANKPKEPGPRSTKARSLVKVSSGCLASDEFPALGSTPMPKDVKTKGLSMQKASCWSKVSKNMPSPSRLASGTDAPPTKHDTVQPQGCGDTNAKCNQMESATLEVDWISPCCEERRNDGANQEQLVEATTSCKRTLADVKKSNKHKIVTPSQKPKAIEEPAPKPSVGRQSTLNIERGLTCIPEGATYKNPDKSQESSLVRSSQPFCYGQQTSTGDLVSIGPKSLCTSTASEPEQLIGDQRQGWVNSTISTVQPCDQDNLTNETLAVASEYSTQAGCEESMHMAVDNMLKDAEESILNTASMDLEVMNEDSLSSSICLLDPSTSNSDSASYSSKTNQSSWTFSSSSALDGTDIQHHSAMNPCAQVSRPQPIFAFQDDTWVSVWKARNGWEPSEDSNLQGTPGNAPQASSIVAEGGRRDCTSAGASSDPQCLSTAEVDLNNKHCCSTIDAGDHVSNSQLGGLGLLLSSSIRRDSKSTKADMLSCAPANVATYGLKGRLPSSLEHIIILGGMESTFTTSVEVWSGNLSSWTGLRDLPYKLVYGDAAALGQFVVVVGGGLDPKAIHSQSLCINSSTGLWHTVAAPAAARANLGLAEANGKVYAVGGGGPSQQLASIEIYDPSVDRWHLGAEMSTARESAGVCSKDGIVYACGGFNGSSFVNTVEMLDPRVGLWQTLPAIGGGRGGLASSIHGNCLWLVGGYDGNQIVDSVEVLDIRARGWIPAVPPLPTARAHCTAEVCEGQLYVIGGISRQMLPEGMERFDHEHNVWESGLAAGRYGTRSYHASCALARQ